MNNRRYCPVERRLGLMWNNVQHSCVEFNIEIQHRNSLHIKQTKDLVHCLSLPGCYWREDLLHSIKAIFISFFLWSNGFVEHMFNYFVFTKWFHINYFVFIKWFHVSYCMFLVGAKIEQRLPQPTSMTPEVLRCHTCNYTSRNTRDIR